MLRQFVQHIGGRRDGVGAQIELQSGFLGGGYEAIGRCLVARDVHVASGHLVACLYAIHIGHAAVRVVSIVVASLDDLDIGLGHSGLLGKLLTQEVEGDVQIAVEEPAHESECKHVAAFEDALDVHAAVLEAVLDHGGERTGNHSIGVDAHLSQVVFALEGGFLKVFGAEAVGVDDDGSARLGVSVLGLKRGRVHGHQHVALVAWCINLPCTHMHLESRHACEGTLRGSDVGRIVGECADAVAYGG